MSETRVAVLGASGFAGALAAWLVQRHPSLELAALTARSDTGTELAALYPRYRVALELEAFDADAIAERADAVLVAYPHGAAAPVVAALRERGLRTVDFSADFRLADRAIYEQWYVPHEAPELFGTATYGLPELNRAAIAEADLVANPGCYPTATLLALAPLAREDLIADVVIDAKSGVSGAGRGGGDATHFVNANENVTPYGVAGHRHQPEIEQELAGLGVKPTLTFVPHLVPLDQGELVSCYVRAGREIGEGELRDLYRAAYESEPFVEISASPPGVREVRDTNICRIHVAFDRGNGRIMVFAAIDNLWKGAASQAIQNLNLMLGRPEEEGIS